MKILKCLAIMLVALHTTTSCNKFLDINPAGEVVNNEMFNNAEGFEEALYGVYAMLGSENLYAGKLGYALSDVAAQYLYPGWSENPIRFISTYNYTDQKVRSHVDTIWTSMYSNIANVNNILENLEKKEPASMRYYNMYKGEALALRAFMHFELTRYYCDNITNNANTIGIPYRESYTFNVFPFEPLSTTYDKIIRDLKSAAELMEGTESYYYSAGDNPSGFVKNREIHISIDAVKAILARVYWTKNDLKTASEYAMEVIKSNRYSCVDNTEIKDLMNGVLSPEETIFGIYSHTKYSLNTQNHLYYSSGDAYVVKEDYLDWYEADREGYDARMDKWFNILSDFSAVGLRLVKILDWYNINQSTRPGSRVKGINVIRIPEMYYIVAEYYLYMEQFTEAHRYFDAVIAKRGLMPYAQRTGFQLSLKNLNIERRKEWVGEGLYFHVMKKYNMDGYDKTTDKTFKASSGIYIFPIPQIELEYNPIK